MNINSPISSIQLLVEQDLESLPKSTKLYYDKSLQVIAHSTSLQEPLSILSMHINEWINQNHYTWLTPIQKAQFLTNVSYINSKIESHNRKIYQNPLLLIWNIFLRVMFLGRIGITWNKIAVDVNAKAREIFQVKTPEARTELIAALPSLNQFQVTKREKDSYYGFIERTHSFIKEYTSRVNLQETVKTALKEKSENYTHYFQALANDVSVFNFQELDSSTYCKITGELANKSESIGNNVMCYRELLYGLEKAISERGILPIHNILKIGERLSSHVQDGNSQLIFEKWDPSWLAFPILKAVAKHRETKTLFIKQDPFIKTLLKESVRQLKKDLEPQKEETKYPEEVISADVFTTTLHKSGSPISTFFSNFLKLNSLLGKEGLKLDCLAEEKDFLVGCLKQVKAEFTSKEQQVLDVLFQPAK